MRFRRVAMADSSTADDDGDDASLPFVSCSDSSHKPASRRIRSCADMDDSEVVLLAAVVVESTSSLPSLGVDDADRDDTDTERRGGE